MIKFAFQKGKSNYSNFGNVVNYLLFCSLYLSGSAYANGPTNDKVVLVLAPLGEVTRQYSSAWAKEHWIQALIDDARTAKVVYSLPFCNQDQFSSCEHSASIKLIIELYAPAGELMKIVEQMLQKYPDLPLAAYRVRERQPSSYTRDWPLGHATPGVRLVALMVRKDHLTRDEFDTYWRNEHTPIAVAQLIAVWNYLQNTVVYCLGACDPVDGIALEQFRNASDPQDRWRKTFWPALKGVWSANKFMDLFESRSQLMTEFVVKDELVQSVKD